MLSSHIPIVYSHVSLDPTDLFIGDRCADLSEDAVHLAAGTGALGQAPLLAGGPGALALPRQAGDVAVNKGRRASLRSLQSSQ